MRRGMKIVTAISCVLLIFSAVACEKEGSAEKAGKQVDQALDDAKKKFEEATK